MTNNHTWKLRHQDANLYQNLTNQQHVAPDLAYLLSLRHIKDANTFLTPLDQPLYDPFLFNDMPKVVQRLQQAYQNHEHVLIYGDYDVDGVTSTSIMIGLLKSCQIDYDYYIPKRNLDGYGPNLKRYKQLIHDNHYDLFITVDNGITGVEEIEYLKQHHIDTIVIDHHTFGSTLPDAYAIIHPGIPGSNYPESILSGAGVCFKVMQAVNPKLSKSFYDLAALGIIADCMLLEGENRRIVARGIEQMKLGNNLGLTTLCRVADLPLEHLTTTDVGFTIAPCLNSAGRLKDADIDVQLLTSTDYHQAYGIAEELIDDNAQRKDITKTVAQQAQAKIDPNNNANVITLDDVQKGLAGLIANRVMSQTGKPTIILTKHDHELDGSARSCNGFDLTKTLRPLTGTVLNSFGGHAYACGLSLNDNQLDHLQDILNQACANLKPTPTYIDLQLPEDQLAHFEETSRSLEPFGKANERFRIMTKITVDECRHMGKDQSSLRITSVDHPNYQYMAFSDYHDVDFKPGTELYIVGTIQQHYWRGNPSLQFIIDDYTEDLSTKLLN